MSQPPSREAFFARFLASFPEAETQHRIVLDEVREASAAEPGRPSAWPPPPYNIPRDVIEDFSSDVRHAVMSGQPEALRLWRNLVHFLESEYGHDRIVDFLIEGVISYLPGRHDPHQELRQDLGPKLTAVLDKERDVRVNPAWDAFLSRMRRRFPELEAFVEENTYGDHDALLATQFLWDVVRHTVELHLSPQAADQARAQSIIDTVAGEYGNDPEVNELIAGAFVDYLPGADSPGADIVRRLPPSLVPVMETVRSDLTTIRQEPPNAP